MSSLPLWGIFVLQMDFKVKTHDQNNGKKKKERTNPENAWTSSPNLIWTPHNAYAYSILNWASIPFYTRHEAIHFLPFHLQRNVKYVFHLKPKQGQQLNIDQWLLATITSLKFNCTVVKLNLLFGDSPDTHLKHTRAAKMNRLIN